MSARLSARSATLALTVGAVALTGAVAAGSPASADSRSIVLRTALSGAAEVPGPGDPDGTGRAKVRVKASTGLICVSITVKGIALPAVMAHIHEGPARMAGPVVQGLTAPDASGASETCVRNPSLAAELVADPADYYVNVHTSQFPAGAVRGQLG